MVKKQKENDRKLSAFESHITFYDW